jgi:integrase
MMVPTTVKLKDRRKVVRTRSRTYIDMLMKHVRRLYRWVSSEGMLPASVHEALKTVTPLKMGRTTARESDPVKPISPEAVEATLKHLLPVVADMVRLQSLLGCRPGETCKITPAMVDRSNDVWEINLVKHKSAWRGKRRTIYVGPEAQEILKPYLLRCSLSQHPRQSCESTRHLLSPRGRISRNTMLLAFLTIASRR